MALLKLAHHMSYCLLHLHIQFHSHTQRYRHASDYFARVELLARQLCERFLCHDR
jgi:hypothetical protein